MSDNLVCGVGVYERGIYVGRSNGKLTKEYILWSGMLNRCYSSKFHSTNPTYIDCSVSENFKNFQFFAEWCNRQVGFNLPTYQLDKDILINGNKVYSEYTCAFVPRQLNTILTQGTKRRGKYPIGVWYCPVIRRYRVRLNVDKTLKHLGDYDTPEEAFTVYKVAKETQVKAVANRYRSAVCPRVYNALLEWTVCITD